MRVLGIDLETQSRADLPRVGAASYAAHASTKVLCASLILTDISQRDDGTYTHQVVRKQRWFPDHCLEDAVLAHLEHGGRVVAHNAMFEHFVIEACLDWPEITPDQWIDTMDEAAALCVPVSLGGAAEVVGAEALKDDEGAALMMSLCKPDRRGKMPEPTPDQLERLMDYCEADVVAMLALLVRILPWAYAGEVAIKKAHREINARGVALDKDLAASITRMALNRKHELEKESLVVTGDFINLNSPAEIRKWFAEVHGHKVDSLAKAEVEAMLAKGDLCPEERRLLELRLEHGRLTSIQKADRAVDMAVEGRIRGVFRYHGAHTGRWTSTGVQLHNMPKPKLKNIGEVLAAVLAEDYDRLKELSPNVLRALSELQRSLLVAAPGCVFLGADFSAIEARVLGWLAGSPGTLDAFREGRDIYAEDAAAIGSDDRQLGKVCRLALGYGMGGVRFHETANAWGVPVTRIRARDITRAWRRANREIPDYAIAMQFAFVACMYSFEKAVEMFSGTQKDRGADELMVARVADRVSWKPGHARVGAVELLNRGSHVAIQLPSGRCLRYWSPKAPRVEKEFPVIGDDGSIYKKKAMTISLEFSRAAGGSMVKDVTYGGKLVENVTQAVARDLLAEAILRLEAAGLPVVLHVHDSVVCEVPEHETPNLSAFEEIVAEVPDWAHGLPMKAEGYLSDRFKG